MTKLLVIAGEASGDLHGGNVILKLKELHPDIEMFGTGGKVLESAGVRLIYRAEDMAVIGIWEVLKRYGYYKGIFNDIVRQLDEEKPDAVFLVDYPAFNLRVAEEAKKRGIKVIYYVAPQVWAWKKNRIHKIKAFVDELICLFPFEVDFFRKKGMDTHCFGHPLIDIAHPSQSKSEVFKKWDLDTGKRLVSLLPGSRRNEILRHFPLLLTIADRLYEKQPDVQFAIPLAPTVSKEEIQGQLTHSNAVIKIIEDDTYNIVGHSDFAAVASGTATLETALLQTPLLIYYKISAFTYVIAKYILRIKAVGLPNIVSGKEIVPELIQYFTSAQDLANTIDHYLTNNREYDQIKQNLRELRANMGEHGAYQKTAEFLNQCLSQTLSQIQTAATQ